MTVECNVTYNHVLNTENPCAVECNFFTYVLNFKYFLIWNFSDFTTFSYELLKNQTRANKPVALNRKRKEAQFRFKFLAQLLFNIKYSTMVIGCSKQNKQTSSVVTRGIWDSVVQFHCQWKLFSSRAQWILL